MAAIIANKVKRERGIRDPKSSSSATTCLKPAKKTYKPDEESYNNLEKTGPDDLIYQVNSSSNIVLYLGLGMASVGLIITFMGIGEKGFRTTHLKLIGPCLIGIGVILSLLRILVCFLPSRKTWCRSSDNLAHKSESAEGAANQNTKTPFVIPFEEAQYPTSNVKTTIPGANSSSFKNPERRTKWDFRKFHSPEYDIEIRMLGSPNLNDNFKETLGGKSKKNFDSNNQLKSTFYDNYGSDTSSEFSVDLSNHQ